MTKLAQVTEFIDQKIAESFASLYEILRRHGATDEEIIIESVRQGLRLRTWRDETLAKLERELV